MTGEGPVVRSEPRPGVVQLTLSRPGKLNAMTWPLVDALHAELRDIAADLSCRVVVLTGADRGFCAGLDLGGFGDVPGASFDAAVEVENRQQVLASATADAREAGAAYRQNRPPAYHNA